ncbi:MAG: efflux RND transporter periplasmic adaptor subunit [Burkholderiaceae bacterium]|nr:efflux RND transporter periplasmic adaptor subunit [Burkholderiaceae bacterium]
MNTTIKKTAVALSLLAAGIAAGWAFSQWQAARSATSTTMSVGQEERKPLYWYDPMVPTQKFDKPGKSPFMDMQLVPKFAGEDTGDAPGVSVSPQALQSLGLRVATVERATVGASIDAVGSLQLNDRDVSIVQARSAGFVERVYARAPGDVLQAGAPLADLLLPEWVAAQREFLAVKALNEPLLTQAARQRLGLLGMSESLISQVERSGQTTGTVTVRAPSSGLLAELMVRQGMTVTPGMSLARINGLGSIWLEAAVPEAQAGAVQPGQAAEARLSAFPGEVFRGRVAAVLPESSRETRTLRVRIELPNPQQRLKAGMFAQVALNGPRSESLVVPAEAIIRTGKRAIAYVVDAPGRYRPVDVEIGQELGDRMIVRRGLEAGQQVVASAQFLIDSEASLQGLTPAAVGAPGAVSASSPAAQVREVVHSTTGTITALTDDSVTLQHAAVPTLQWPAMTMGFKVLDPKLKAGLQPRQIVQFSFIQQGDDYVVTAIKPADPVGGKP